MDKNFKIIKKINRKIRGFIIFSILLFLIGSSTLSLYGQENTNACDQALFNIGRNLKLFEIVTGKFPEKLSELYTLGFVKQLNDFQCSKTEAGIEHVDEIDDKADLALPLEKGLGEEDPILLTKVSARTPLRALLRNGEIIDWGKKETPDQPRTEAQQKLDQELLKAAEEGNLNEVQKAMQAGADVNAKGKGGATALGWASSKGFEDMVRLLIKAGADIHWEATRGQTALHVAAHQGQAELIKILISYGAHVNQKIKSETAPKGYQGATALFMAVENNKVNAVQVLLQSGANVNATNKFGASTLMFSIDSESLEAMRLLIEAGADLNVTFKGDGPGAGTTALMGAAAQGSGRVVQMLLLAGADVKAKDANGATALDHALQKEHTKIVKLLREPELASMLEQAKAALEPDMMEAVEDGDMPMVKWLLKLGVSADSRDEKGISALMLSIKSDSVEMVQVLLDSGADVNAADGEYGATALIMAASKGKEEITKILIQSGADINRKAKGDNKGEGAGWTALMAAAMAGDRDLVSQLLSAGAKRELTNGAGESALDIAKKEGYLDLVALLETSSIPKTSSGIESDLVGPWIFGRVNGPVLCDIVLTTDKGEYGNIIKACHPNESFWSVENEELVFLNSIGQAMSRFRKEKGKNYWQGPFLPDSRITHYIKKDG